MSQGKRIPRRSAERLWAKIHEALAPGCERLEVAGSLRRRALSIGDIEAVAIPAITAGLFHGQPGESCLLQILGELVRDRRLHFIRGGERQRVYAIPATGTQLDLYIVAPETWGYHFAVRTGPAEFSKALVTERSRGGRLRDGLICREGRVWHADQVTVGMIDGRDYTGPFFLPHAGAEPLDTPEERDFLELAGGWLPPEARRVDAPIRDELEAPCK
jgi:hypothetical protein